MVNLEAVTAVMVLAKTIERPVVNTHEMWIARGCRWLCWGPAKSEKREEEDVAGGSVGDLYAELHEDPKYHSCKKKKGRGVLPRAFLKHQKDHSLCGVAVYLTA